MSYHSTDKIKKTLKERRAQRSVPIATPTSRTGRTAIISPSPNPTTAKTKSNSFGALQSESEDDGSNNTNSIISNNSTADDYDYIYEDYGNDMTTIPSIYAQLTSEECRPINDPNMIQVQAKRSRIANILSLIISPLEATGHSSIVETLEGHRRRVDDKTATLPLPPPRPTMPTDNKHFGKYKFQLDLFNKYKSLDNEVITIVNKVFPNGLTDKEIDANGMLPLSMTARIAFDHIEKKTKTDIVATKAYSQIILQMAQRKYNPNGNGSVQFMQDMKEDQFGANLLAGEASVTDGMVMTLSRQAFITSGHKVADITEDNTAWNTMDAASKKNKSNAMYIAERLDEFSNFYNLKLKSRWDLGDHGTTHQAHNATELINRIEGVETKNAQLAEDVTQIYDNQSNIVAHIPDMTGTGSVASAFDDATTRNQDAEITSMRHDMSEMACVIKELKINAATPTQTNNRTTPGRSDETRVWRQWNFWCWSCGTNLTHNSGECSPDRHNYRRGHKKSATKSNPDGGNVRRNHLWGKWCHPIDHKVHDNRGG